ncbi:hypothetical protein ACIQUW_32990 [Streptomyces sp. NPDC101117]|uniref:hypothetical protein n=1 Tax=Streptomyces sp. NPDC101117 TaxID=3366108 RepID=UPI0037F6E507
MTGRVSRVDIVFYGLLVDAGELTRQTAAEQLVEVASYRISVLEARQLIDTWQAYRTPHRNPAAEARSSFLSRLFTRRTTNPKGTDTR